VTSRVRSARDRLLGRRNRRLGDGERADLAVELGEIEAHTSCGPIAGTQLEKPVARPVRQDAEEVAQVGLRIEAVEARRGDQREQIACGLGVIVAANEEPVLAPDGDAAELALGGVVVELESTIVVEAGQRSSLAMRVAERGAEESALIADALVLGLDPREERVGVRSEVECAQRVDLGRWLLSPRPVELEDAADSRQALARDRVLRDRGFPELAPCVRLIPCST